MPRSLPNRPLRPAALAVLDAPWKIRAAPLRAVVPLLVAQGLQVAPLLSTCGLPADALDDDERWLPFGAGTHLLGMAAQRLRCEDLGLRMADGLDARVLGTLGARMMLAPTVGAALQVLRRDFHLHDRGAVPYLDDMGGGRVALGYAPWRHDTLGLDVVHALALAIGLKLLRGLCGPGFQLKAVQMTHAAPREPRPFHRHFGVPVQFGAARTQLDFDAKWLARPLPGGDAALRAQLERAVRGQDQGLPRSTGERVRSVAQLLLLTGDLSEPRIAAELGLHVRTLRRQLRAEGLACQALMADVRDQYAQQLLTATRLPLAEIADATQYADVSAFARAFRRRVGVAPGRWRALNPPADRG